MCRSSDEKAAHGDKDHGVGNVDTFFVVAHEAAPTGHPTESALHDPTARQDFKSLLAIGPTDDVNNEVDVGRLVHEIDKDTSKSSEVPSD